MNPALLILDMLNTFDFPEARLLHPSALKAAQSIAALKEKFKTQNLPVIYVNDNFGNWQSNWEKIYQMCSSPDCLGKDIAETLKPTDSDYFILKPMHSGFYSSSLESLLNTLEVDLLYITGIAGNICVLFTVNDAHMRHYKIVVPKDCIASNTKEDNEFALRQFREVFQFKTPMAHEIAF